MLIFALFFAVFVAFPNVKSYDCGPSTPTYKVTNDNFVFLQSPNYPKFISNSSYSLECNAQLIFSNYDFVWIAMLNGKLSNVELFDGSNHEIYKKSNYYSSNTEILTFTTKSPRLLLNILQNVVQFSWSAFQAAVVPYSQSNANLCPLSGRVFDFETTPDLIVPVVSEFGDYNLTNPWKFCNWAFKLGSMQKLKIVVKKVKPSNDFYLSLWGDGKVVKNFVDTFQSKFEAFYFEGTNFNMTFSNQWANNSDSGFFILVSAVNDTKSLTNVGCHQSIVTSSELVFSNFDSVYGYPPYQYCENNFTVSSNHEASLKIKTDDYENCCDILSLSYGNNQNEIIRWNAKRSLPYKLKSGIGSSKLLFEADGNTELGGFVADIQIYECTCSESNIIIDCENGTSIFPIPNRRDYCDKMDCSYRVVQNPKCPNIYLSCFISLQLRPALDQIIIKENNEIIQTLTASPDNTYMNFFYTSKSNLSFEFHSGASNDVITNDKKNWDVYMEKVPTPKFTKTTLDDTKTKHVLILNDMNQGDAIIVHSTKGDLEIYVTYDAYSDLSSFSLYDSDDLRKFVGNLDSDSAFPSSSSSLARHRKSNSGYFTIYFKSITGFPLDGIYTVLFKNSYDSSNNCQNANTVYQVPARFTSDQYTDFSVASNDKLPCEMIILSYFSTFDLPKIWIQNISATQNADFSFVGTSNQKQLLSLSSSEISQWQSFGIYTQALSVIVPPSSGIILHISSNLQFGKTIAINLANGEPQKGILASPNYAGYMQTFDTLLLYQTSNFYGEVFFNFVFKEISGNPVITLQFNRNNITIASNMTFTSTGFALYYSAGSPKTDGFNIEYTIRQTQSDVTTVPNSEESLKFFEYSIFFVLFLNFL